MSDIEQVAFALWRFEMWSLGFGSYDSIHKLVRLRVLRPYKRPGIIRKAVARFLLSHFYEAEDA